MSLQFAKIGHLDPSTQKDLLDRSFDQIWARKDRFAGNLAQFFMKAPADSLNYKMTSEGSSLPLVPVNNDGDDIPFESAAPGFPKDFILLVYRMGVQVTRTMLKADRFGKIEGKLTGLTKSAMRTKEFQRSNIFDNAFSGTSGSDSLPLCDNLHPHENGEAGTWDNLGTGDLTHANLQALRLLGRVMTEEQGFPDEVFMRTLLIRPELEQKADELILSSLMPENDLNQKNVLNKYRKVVNNFLTSATAFFTIGDLEGEEKGLHEFFLEDINVMNTNPEDPDIVLSKRVKFTDVIGFTRSKNVAGSAGV